jgi:phosphoribosylanthranilate isomerase
LKTRVKICCIASKQEADIAVSFGAYAIGLVGNMPSGPGIISDELIAEIASGVPPHIATFLLTSETIPDKIIDHHLQTLTNTIQIVDEVLGGTHQIIKKLLPAIKIVQVIHVSGDDSVDEALRISENVDALLLDSGNQKLQIKELGGTGRTHNWRISKKIVEQSKVPVFLAGGLTPNNVSRAIEMVQPFGVDVCSGVRTNSALDPKKLELFFKSISG